MKDPSHSSADPVPGRIARPRMTAHQTGWMHWLPGLLTLRNYEISWLASDIVAGLALTAMLVPVGIAYAVASGLTRHLRALRNDCSAAGLCTIRP
jgi:hypothetical protein